MFALLLAALPFAAAAQEKLTETYSTSAGNVVIAPVGHGSLIIMHDGKIIHVDPYSQVEDYSKLPKADLVLITHEHADHYDPAALTHVVTPNTEIIGSQAVADLYDRVDMHMDNGDVAGWRGIRIEAVPAYNIVNLKEGGEAYHPKGRGNGYVLTFGDFRIYIAGDTENIPEMKNLGDIDVAFLPKNLPFTMSDQQFIEAAKMVQPKVLYPYHYSKVNKAELQRALPGIEIQ